MCGASLDRRGFSLIEAVIALAIVGAISVAGLASFAAQTRAAERGRTLLLAETLATEQLELLRLVPAADLSPLPDSLRKGRFPKPYESYAWERTVRPVRDIPNLYQAIVAVSWDTGGFSLETRLYRPGRGLGRP